MEARNVISLSSNQEHTMSRQYGFLFFCPKAIMETHGNQSKIGLKKVKTKVTLTSLKLK